MGENGGQSAHIGCQSQPRVTFEALNSASFYQEPFLYTFRALKFLAQVTVSKWQKNWVILLLRFIVSIKNMGLWSCSNSTEVRCLVNPGSIPSMLYKPGYQTPLGMAPK